jgi:COP9 signalosome complex subunit 3
VNTVSYVFALHAHITAAHKVGKASAWAKLWDKFANLLETFDTRQIRFVGKEFTHIIDAMVKHARSSHKVRLL